MSQVEVGPTREPVAYAPVPRVIHLSLKRGYHPFSNGLWLNSATQFQENGTIRTGLVEGPCGMCIRSCSHSDDREPRSENQRSKELLCLHRDMAGPHRACKIALSITQVTGATFKDLKLDLHKFDILLSTPRV